VTDQALAISTRDPVDLRLQFVAPLEVLQEQLKELEQFKLSIMIPGLDFGVIPGTDRPTLLKPGAEKLALAYGMTPLFSDSKRIEDWENGFFFYEFECTLINRRTEAKMANAIGSANSKEPRYRWRDARPACPECGEDLRRSKRTQASGDNPGWYCWRKMGGCGREFPRDQIKVGRVENPEPYELVNTLQKMAQKRALVAAVLLATGGSSIWTQDLEDIESAPDEERVVEVPTREREVNDAPRAEPKRGPGRPPKPVGPDEMISSGDHDLWKRWLQVKGEAEKLGVRVSELRLPLSRRQLVDHGLLVAKAKTERLAKLADEDAARAAGANARAADQAERGTGASAWDRNRELVDEAYALGLKPLILPSNAPIAEVEAANLDLMAAIDAFDAE